MKRLLKGILVFILIVFIKLLFSYIINEIIIYNYNRNIYNDKLIKSLYILNFYQPYIAYYNEGNIYYMNNKYDLAINKYNDAINKNPPKKKVCDIRINMSLAMIKNINSKDSTIIYNNLEEAKKNLYIDNCANEDGSGSSNEAEDLKNEIKRMQDELNNKSDDSNDDPTDDNNTDSDLEDKLKDISRQSSSSRQADLSTYENLDNYSYYSGKKW